MTGRQQIEAAFRGERGEHTPVSIRLDLWHAHAARIGALPKHLHDASATDVEDALGFARAARFRMHPRLVFDAADFRCEVRNGVRREDYRFPKGTLTRETVTTAESARSGVQPHITQYPLHTEADYELLLRHVHSARLEYEFEGFDIFDAETGGKGLPMLIASSCPAHLIMLRWAGYENFFLHLFDFEEKAAELIRAVDDIFRRDLWPVLQASSATLLLHGNHFSSQMTPPPLFERFFLPYFQAFNELMHAHGKCVVWHADAEIGALVELVLAAGFDGADCLATAPLVPQTMKNYLNVWQGRIVCWGGLPSTIFDPEYPLQDYQSHVLALFELAADRSDIIIGASDNVMPGAEWKRLEFLAEQSRRNKKVPI